MSTTLYRKYRPQTFTELVNQELVRKTLENEIKAGQLAHAYLFSGARGLGKTTTARLLAKAVNCKTRKNTESEPCNKCVNCQAINNNQFLDLIEIDAASNRGINEIRQLKEHIGFTPASANFRVFIIDEVHMLTSEAFNALLKTLEEPPTHAIFILATTEFHKVPATIVSRCQSFVFKRVSENELIKRLEKIVKCEGVKLEKQVLGQIVHLSGGFIRDAESLLGQVLSLGEKNITAELASLVIPSSNVKLVVEFLSYLSDRQINKAIKLINSLTDQGIDLEYFTRETLETLRLLLINHYDTEAIIDEDVQKLKNSFKIDKLLRLINLMDQAFRDLKKAEIPELPLELAVVEYISTQKQKNTEITENINNRSINNHSDNKLNTDINIKTELKSQANKVNKSINLKISDIVKKWPKVIVASQKLNHSMPLILKIVHPLTFNELGDRVLELGCEYEFHLKKLSDLKVKGMLEQVFKDVFNILIIIKARAMSIQEIEKIHEQMDEKSKIEEEKLVDKVMQVFSGEIVNN